MTWQVAAAGAVVCGIAGAVAPYLIRRLPEPPQAAPVEGEPPKVPYLELGARRAALPIGVTLSALAGGSLGAVLGWDWLLVLVWPLVPVAVLLAWVDWHTRLLPRIVVLPATAYALGYGLVRALAVGEYDDLVRGVIALAVVRSFFWLLWRIRSAGMGFGDVRLSALLGLVLGYVGWTEVIVALYVAFVSFAVPFVVLAVARRDRSMMKRAYPFGPFLIFGAWLGLVAGTPLAAALGY